MYSIVPGLVFKSVTDEPWVVGWVEDNEVVALPVARHGSVSWSGPIHEFVAQFTYINRRMPGNWVVPP